MSATLETSALTVATLPLAPAWIRRLASARVSGLRARIATSAPDAANFSAIASPRPLLPPVITAHFPSSLTSISGLLRRAAGGGECEPARSSLPGRDRHAFYRPDQAQAMPANLPIPVRVRLDVRRGGS